MSGNESSITVPTIAPSPNPQTWRTHRLNWTIEKCEQLTRWLALGVDCPSYGAIAESLFPGQDGRSAVAGKVYRMAIKLTPEQREQRRLNQLVARRAPHSDEPQRGSRPSRARRTPDGPPLDQAESIRDFTPPDVQYLCTLDELGPILSATDQASVKCRAPVGDPSTESFRYCGAPGAHLPGPYCLFHHRMFYRGYGTPTEHLGPARVVSRETATPDAKALIQQSGLEIAEARL